MGWYENTQNENPLWRQYMNELGKMDIEEARKWEMIIELPIDLPLKTISSTNYSQDEFLEKLQTDEEFNKRWGTLK